MINRDSLVFSGSFRDRAGETIAFTYDARSEPDAAYSYDLLGRMLSAAQNGVTATFGYDTLGR